MMPARSLAELQLENIRASRRGVTIIATAAVVLAVVGALGWWLPERTMGLVLFGGMGLIFPLGLLLNRLLGIDFFIQDNPLGTLGGLAAVWQQFFTPLFIWFYFRHLPQLPMLVGVVAGAHFFVYAWLYSSRTYWFLTIATVAVAYGGGLLFATHSFVVVPWSMAVVYGLGVLGLLRENRADLQPQPRSAASVPSNAPAKREPAGEIRCNPFFELLSSPSL
ncbi:hypothetical protein LGH70_17260 [Hymenobacter sp. BT635]|uniref:Uncharacterized protein n=1 Tax=Hymenobacter nitidus TaxID=2880929 RepID=A0ABS8AFY1_9BACT|nr:hypothetical protein [Hymenobacter nitidus]MCB2379350.1 hypothetical protein [Hymenobacter nitidus]